MIYPSLSVIPEKIYRTDRFLGLNTGENVPFGEFSDMENLTCDGFPDMKVREKRGIFSSSSGETSFSADSPVTAAVNTAEGVLIITQDSVFLGGKKLGGISLKQGVKNRSAVPIGRNVFIVPDGIYIKITDEGADVICCNKEINVTDCDITMCLRDGTDIYPHYYGTFPESASAGEKLVISSSDTMELYSFTGSEWVKTDDLYIRIPVGESAAGFGPGQSLYIEASDELFSDGFYTVKNITENSLILEGSIPTEIGKTSVSVKSEVPVMDFATEHNNRIWGCRFGENNRGEFVNEIYSSKLGDPSSWYSFKGISTDSYIASLGCSGEFTGTVSTGSEVLFFKENHIIRVFGNTPSDFQVSAVPARGVEKGCHRTVVNLNERIFYKNAEGIMLYDGTFPVNVSPALERKRFTASCAGGIDGKYYISMTESDGRRGLFVFDTATGLWHREDDRLCTEFIFNRDGVLIFTGLRDKEISFFLSSYEKNTGRQERLLSPDPFIIIPEEPVSFFALTGRAEYPRREKEKLRAVYLTLNLGEDSFVEMSLFSREDGVREKIFYLDKCTDTVIRVPVNIPDTERSSLYFRGQGELTVCSVEHRIRKTGEVRNIE